MKNAPSLDEINSLFTNGDTKEVWLKASDIIKLISPGYDFSIVQTSFNDVVRLFRGEYPGYCQIKTLYHNLHHTMDVFLSAVRLMHGVHISGTRFTDQEMTMIMMGALMHDIGYAQRVGEEAGTGAQFTLTHVGRGIKFMQSYIAEHGFPPGLATRLKFIIRCTDPAESIPGIDFPDERTHLLGQLVSSADLTGQMADRTYLEKLLFLYLEFKEAQFGNYQSIHDMLSKTQDFYEKIHMKLDTDLGGIYTKLSFHFKDRYGVDKNYYLESIEKNIAYLNQITKQSEEKHLAMLKRGGIVEKSELLLSHKNHN
ncbi:MAG: HD domain-containing protein [Gallionella sp.]